jgi:hypothetical protein
VRLAEFEKIERIFVHNRKLGLSAKCRSEGAIKIGLAEKGFLVALVFDLMGEGRFCPAEFGGHAEVKFAFEGVFAARHESSYSREVILQIRSQLFDDRLSPRSLLLGEP